MGIAQETLGALKLVMQNSPASQVRVRCWVLFLFPLQFWIWFLRFANLCLARLRRLPWSKGPICQMHCSENWIDISFIPLFYICVITDH